MLAYKPHDITGRYIHLVDEDRAAVEAAPTASMGDLVDGWLATAEGGQRRCG